MSKSIEFNAVLAEITLGVFDKKGKEDKRHNIVPIKIECEVSSDVISGLLGISNVPKLWDKNGDKLFPLGGSMKSIVQYQHHNIKMLNHMFEDVPLRGFSFVPITQNRAQMKFSTTIIDPTPDQLAFLTNCNRESLEIDVSCPQGELDLDQKK